jgi:hypothetical protein
MGGQLKSLVTPESRHPRAASDGYQAREHKSSEKPLWQ